jgi:hypothetical protein
MILASSNIRPLESIVRSTGCECSFKGYGTFDGIRMHEKLNTLDPNVITHNQYLQ